MNVVLDGNAVPEEKLLSDLVRQHVISFLLGTQSFFDLPLDVLFVVFEFQSV